MNSVVLFYASFGLILICPVFIKEMENREQKRFRTGSHCNLECAIAHKVKIKDISMGGICLETSRYVDTKSIYDMLLITKRNEKVLLKGEIVWSALKESRRGKANVYPIYNIGFKFIGQTDSKNKFLEDLTEYLSKSMTSRTF